MKEVYVSSQAVREMREATICNTLVKIGSAFRNYGWYKADIYIFIYQIGGPSLWCGVKVKSAQYRHK